MRLKPNRPILQRFLSGNTTYTYYLDGRVIGTIEEEGDFFVFKGPTTTPSKMKGLMNRTQQLQLAEEFMYAMMRVKMGIDIREYDDVNRQPSPIPLGQHWLDVEDAPKPAVAAAPLPTPKIRSVKVELGPEELDYLQKLVINDVPKDATSVIVPIHSAVDKKLQQAKTSLAL
jgi:hypothetical protein